jgi:hypothetical protein
MKKIGKILLWVLGILVVAVVILSFIGPKTFKMTRSIYIQADRAVVWQNVSLWEKQKAWSPWVAKEPSMKITIDGTDGEVGSKYSWESKTQGNGHQEITASKPMEFRTAKMNFGWGMESMSDFELKDSTTGTIISWNMYGDNNFMARAMGVFMNMEKMVGPDFENGLTNLKKICESTSQK